jgi:hypothetical protein
LNSTGARADVLISGAAKISSNDLGFTSTDLPASTPTLVFIGSNQVDLPLGGGRPYAGYPIGRLETTFADPLGVVQFPFDNTFNLGGAPAVIPGETRYFQAW